MTMHFEVTVTYLETFTDRNLLLLRATSFCNYELIMADPTLLSGFSGACLDIIMVYFHIRNKVTERNKLPFLLEFFLTRNIQ